MQFVEIDKQLEKLAYIEDVEIKNFFSGIKNWKAHLENSYTTIKKHIDKYTQKLLHTHKDSFNLEANKQAFKTYFFKSRANNLTVEDLQKGLITPNKLMTIKKELGI